MVGEREQWNERWLDRDAYDPEGRKVGTIGSLWHDDRTGELAYVGVKTGWLGKKVHVVPAEGMRFDETRGGIELPYGEDRVKDAPKADPDHDMDPSVVSEARAYFGLAGAPATRSEPMEPGARTRADHADIELSEEELHVGKREVPTGARLRKVVRTEHVTKPVDLRREEVEVTREPASGAAPADAFQEKEYHVPAVREEAVAEKRAHLRERVHAERHGEMKHEEVEADLRREELEEKRETGRRSEEHDRGAF